MYKNIVDGDHRVEPAPPLLAALPAVGPAHRGGFGGSAPAWFVSKALSSPSLFGRPMGRGTSSAPALPNLPERVPRAATADPLPLDDEASDDEGGDEVGDGDERKQRDDDDEADQSHEARALRKKEEHERKKRRAAAEAEKARQWKEDLPVAARCQDRDEAIPLVSVETGLEGLAVLSVDHRAQERQRPNPQRGE